MNPFICVLGNCIMEKSKINTKLTCYLSILDSKWTENLLYFFGDLLLGSKKTVQFIYFLY